MTDAKPKPRLAEILSRILAPAEPLPVYAVARHTRRRLLACQWRRASTDRRLACRWEAR